ncbi:MULTISPECIES: hypothetical protein [Anaerofustis]|uniref:hypothetical protein n=1 Tax=Anaerofustis TaxID=264995 RepID=UPI001106941E|nr:MULTISPECIES: hypothetical protein [Anaerofustis]MCO8193003.1 hypothetical protein [Anaerofustis sp. NSJ-163]
MQIKYSNSGYLFFKVSEESILDLSIISKVLFSFGRGVKQLIKEYPGEVSYFEKERGFLVPFSQEDMTRFREGDDVEYDVKFIYKTGDSYSTDIGNLEIGEVVNKNTYNI